MRGANVRVNVYNIRTIEVPSNTDYPLLNRAGLYCLFLNFGLTFTGRWWSGNSAKKHSNAKNRRECSPDTGLFVVTT